MKRHLEESASIPASRKTNLDYTPPHTFVTGGTPSEADLMHTAVLALELLKDSDYDPEVDTPSWESDWISDDHISTEDLDSDSLEACFAERDIIEVEDDSEEDFVPTQEYDSPMYDTPMYHTPEAQFMETSE